jgi:hypothetical protein
MGYPILTRLGVNQFWYRHWYADTMYASNLHLDQSIETLIYFYLNYGISSNSNTFMHEYWYKPNYNHRRYNLSFFKQKNYFRRFFYSHSILGIDHNYLVRHTTNEYFPMRTWIFRYMGWILFSYQWYKPVKQKKKQPVN